jgi:DNA repair exonuclease SbcCD ATPase subunit
MGVGVTGIADPVVIKIVADSSGAQQSVGQFSSTLTAAFAQMQQQAERLTAAVSSSSARQVASLDTIIQATHATARSTLVMAQEMQNASRTATSATQSMSSGFTGLHSTVLKVTGALAAFGLTFSAASLIRGAVESAASFEDLDVQLRFLLGDMAKFEQAKAFILKFTAETPLQLGEVTKAFSLLTRAGLDAQAILPRVVDVASLSSFPKENLDRIVLALTQIADRGKLAGQELIQLSQAGVPIGRVREELAALGVTIAGDIGAASVSAAQGIQAIMNVLEKDFKGAVAATLGNWNVIVSNMADVWSRFQDVIIRGPLFDFLKAGADLLREQMQSAVENNSAAFARFGVVAVKAIENVALAIAGLLDLFNAVKAAAAATASAIPGFFAPIGKAAQAVVDLGLGNLKSQLETLGVDPKRFDATLAALKAVAGLGGPLQVTAKSLEEINKAAGQPLTPFTKQVEDMVKAIRQRDAELQKLREDALAAAKGVQPRAEQPNLEAIAGVAKAYANSLKAQEAELQASLKRQEALVDQSFNDRRQLIEADTVAQVAAATSTGQLEEATRLRTTRLAALAQEEARELEGIRLDMNARLLQATMTQLDAEIKAHAGQPDQIAKFEAEKAKAVADNAARLEEIYRGTADAAVKFTKQSVDEQIADQQRLLKQIEDVNTKIEQRDEQMMERRRRDIERGLEAEARAYEQFVDRVTGKVADIFEGLLKGTLSLVDTFKEIFLKTIAQLAAELATQVIIIPIVGSLIGITGLAGAGGLFGGGTGSGEGGGSSGLMGIVQQLFGLGTTATSGASLVSNLTDALGLTDSASGVTLMGRFADLLGVDATTSLTDMISVLFNNMSQSIVSGVDTLFNVGPSSAANQALLFQEELQGGAASGAGLGASATQIAAAAAGIVGIGAGIYAAINANTTEAKAAYAASAAASAAAATSAILVSAGVIGATTSWTGIGAIVAAVTAAIGLILDQVISPAGPSLGVQLGTGLTIGTQDNQLNVGGDLTSEVTRNVNLPADQSGITTSLESAVTGMVEVMVNAINQVAVDAPALLGPAQDALNTALASAASINSASADNMKTDVEAFLQFIPLQVATQFLDPIMQAFQQTHSLDLDGKIAKLPQAAGQLAGVFFGLQKAVDNLTNVSNTDVLRRISDLQTPLSEFFDSIFRTVDDLTKDIFQDLDTRSLDEQLKLLPRAIASVGAVIQTFTDGLNAMSGQTFGDRDHLRREIDELRVQLNNAAVATANDIVQGVFAKVAVDLPKLLNSSIEVEFLSMGSFFSTQMRALQTLIFAQSQLGQVGAHPEDLNAPITELVGSILTSVTTIVQDALSAGSSHFTDTLAIIQSIPDAVVALNPAMMQMKAMAAAFAPVAKNYSTSIAEIEKALDSASVEADKARARVASLDESLVQAGTDISVALPLWEALRVATLDQLNAEIAALQEAHQARIDAIQDEIDAINEAADAQLAAIDTQRKLLVADQDALQAESDLVQAQIDAINEVADAQLAALDTQRHVLEAERDTLQVQADVIQGQKDVLQGQRDIVQAQQQATQAQVDAITEVTNTLTTQMDQLNQMQDETMQAIMPTQSPAAQQADLEAMIAADMAQLATVPMTADEQIALMQEMVDLNEQLLQLGEDTNQLDVQQEAVDNLAVLSVLMNDMEASLSTQLTEQQQQLAVAQDSLDVLDAQLESIDAQMDVLDAQLDALEALMEPLNQQLNALDVQTQAIQDQTAILLDPLNAQLAAIDALLAPINAQLDALDTQTQVIQDQTAILLDPLNAQLKEAQDTTILNQQIKDLQTAALAELQAMQASLQNLFLIGQLDGSTQGSSLTELTGIHTDTSVLAGGAVPVAVAPPPPSAAPPPSAETPPPPSEPAQAAPPPPPPSSDVPYSDNAEVDAWLKELYYSQAGGLLHLAQGGMVQTMLEPGEGYVLPPMTMAQQGALLAWNTAFPRFGEGGIVPGSGSGDTVRALMPEGTVVLNRHAMRAMETGGMVPSSSGGLMAVDSSTSGGLTAMARATSGGFEAVEQAVSDLSKLFARTFQAWGGAGRGYQVGGVILTHTPPAPMSSVSIGQGFQSGGNVAPMNWSPPSRDSGSTDNRSTTSTTNHFSFGPIVIQNAGTRDPRALAKELVSHMSDELERWYLRQHRGQPNSSKPRLFP